MKKKKGASEKASESLRNEQQNGKIGGILPEALFKLVNTNAFFSILSRSKHSFSRNKKKDKEGRSSSVPSKGVLRHEGRADTLLSHAASVAAAITISAASGAR